MHPVDKPPHSHRSFSVGSARLCGPIWPALYPRSACGVLSWDGPHEVGRRYYGLFRFGMRSNCIWPMQAIIYTITHIDDWGHWKWGQIVFKRFWTWALYNNCAGHPMQNPCKAHATPTLYPRDTDSIHIAWVWHGPTWVWHGLACAVTVQRPCAKLLESSDGQLRSAYAVHVGWTALGLRSTHEGSSTGLARFSPDFRGKKNKIW